MGQEQKAIPTMTDRNSLADAFDALADRAAVEFPDHFAIQQAACALLGGWAIRNRALISAALRSGESDAACNVCAGTGETGTAYTLNTIGYAGDKKRMEDAENMRQRCWKCGGTGKTPLPPSPAATGE